MIQAATEGAIDFRQANTLDRTWWLRTRWITDSLARRNRAAVLALQHHQHASAVDYKTQQTTFEHHWDASNALVMQVTNLLLPWIDTTPLSPEEMAQRLYDRYVEEFGAPGSAEHDAEVEKLLEYWRSGREAA